MTLASTSEFRAEERARFFRLRLECEADPYSIHKAMLTRTLDAVLLDVRSAESRAKGHIPGSLHIPRADLERRLGDLPRDQEIVTYCGSITCLASTKAALFLSERGYRAKSMVGGWKSWVEAGYPTSG